MELAMDAYIEKRAVECEKPFTEVNGVKVRFFSLNRLFSSAV